MEGTSLDRDLIRSARFRQEREAGWKRLDNLLTKVERSGVEALNFEEANELSALYRQSLNSLSLAREISLDRALLSYLESLSSRACLAIYAPQRTLMETIVGFFTHGVPQAVRRSKVHFLLAFIFMTIGVLVAYWLTKSDSSWYYAFVGRDFSGGRGPEATAAYLRSVLYGQSSTDKAQLAAFSANLFTHNTQVSFFAFALGIMAGLPTSFLMFYNGTVLGAFIAVHESKGLAWDLFGWLSIHGVTELTAILMAGAGGLRLGGAVVFPGSKTRVHSLRAAGRDAAHLALLAALMLIAAGLLEGFGRQLIDSFYVRVAVGWGAGALWLLWFVASGRRKRQAQN